MHGVLLLSNGPASSVCERRVLYLTYCSVANNVSHIRGRQRNTRQRSARLRTMTRHPFDSGHGRLGCSETGDMVEKRTDQRVERTRKLLQDALISMMIDKG